MPVSGVAIILEVRGTEIAYMKKHWVDFYHYSADVYSYFKHTFMFIQHVQWILHPTTPLKMSYYFVVLLIQLIVFLKFSLLGLKKVIQI